jgi:hypothetical protein
LKSGDTIATGESKGIEPAIWYVAIKVGLSTNGATGTCPIRLLGGVRSVKYPATTKIDPVYLKFAQRSGFAKMGFEP